jgi:hypothetical protein
MDIKQMEKAVIVDDHMIISATPLTIKKHGRVFKIEQVRWLDWEKFTLYMSVFLNHYVAVAKTMDLPEKIQDYEYFRNDLRTTFSSRQACRAFFKLCKIHKLNIRFIKKHFTVDDMAEFFAYFYLYNVKSVKLDCKTALSMMGQN